MYVVVDRCGGSAVQIDGEHLGGTVRSGGILGEMALIDAGAAQRHCDREERNCVLVADRRAGRFSLLVSQRPEFALHVMRVLANRYAPAWITEH
jgi:hypothetical protein